jgi:hypothetical protein
VDPNTSGVYNIASPRDDGQPLNWGGGHPPGSGGGLNNAPSPADINETGRFAGAEGAVAEGGAAAGAAEGAEAGTVVPGVGNVVGAVGGAAIGEVASHHKGGHDSGHDGDGPRKR